TLRTLLDKSFASSRRPPVAARGSPPPWLRAALRDAPRPRASARPPPRAADHATSSSPTSPRRPETGGPREPILTPRASRRRAAARRGGSQTTEHNVVGVRVAATKHESFLEAALDRHLARSREPSRSLRSFLIRAIESLESRRYVGGLKAQAGQRKCSHAVR